jgi:hypothetical protein
MSRHLNTHEALVLYDRAASKLQMGKATAFRDYAGAIMDFRVHALA